MKMSILLVIFLALQGCSSMLGELKLSESSGVFNPVTLASVDPEKYKSDKQLCLKQIETQNSKDLGENYNIIKFRACLIQKGYVLLS
jgi:uncharacterized protein YceK